ncbi:PREDICTED: protein FAM69C [Rhagoletis zephyria]|uniref:protein FAM69C n=1 Tax=Rhagoletis zephyria TaxID=28612 RepID=UPI0008116BD1|nr:PREDICTED: protein FAM69C [Rhagoletis zephyria]
MLFFSWRRKTRLKENLMWLLVPLLVLGCLLSIFSMECIFKKSLTINHMCKMYERHKYRGSLCEELCSEQTPFENFNCPNYITAQKNGDVIEFRRADRIYVEDLAWSDKRGHLRYPKIDDFYHIVKLHILINYNVTLEDNMIKLLINQEIDESNPDQMLNFWRLFKDNNYLMGKLFDDDGLFSTIGGACGPVYIVEHLKPLELRNSFTRFFLNSPPEQMLFKRLLNYIMRLDMIRPDPLKICKIDLYNFGFTTDSRLKAFNANHIAAETQVNKRLASGQPCSRDEDCDWHQCHGSCDKRKHICNGAQKNDNLAIFCDYVMEYPYHFPELKMQPAVLELYKEKCLQPRSKIRWND